MEIIAGVVFILAMLAVAFARIAYTLSLKESNSATPVRKIKPDKTNPKKLKN